jgi:hypothetical protein
LPYYKQRYSFFWQRYTRVSGHFGLEGFSLLQAIQLSGFRNQAVCLFHTGFYFKPNTSRPSYVRIKTFFETCGNVIAKYSLGFEKFDLSSIQNPASCREKKNVNVLRKIGRKGATYEKNTFIYFDYGFDSSSDTLQGKQHRCGFSMA